MIINIREINVPRINEIFHKVINTIRMHCTVNMSFVLTDVRDAIRLKACLAGMLPQTS